TKNSCSDPAPSTTYSMQRPHTQYVIDFGPVLQVCKQIHKQNPGNGTCH
ncbi:hypothetical protein D041_3925B, partial [Vibrio parahaemolyticus EKP-008]